MRTARIVLVGCMALAMAQTPPAPGALTVDVGNVRAARGMVRIDVCPEKHWLSEHCPWHGHAAAHLGTTTVTVIGVPAGNYGVQAYLDENDNDNLDRGLFGIPKEGIGFSNDAKITLGPPKYRDAAFSFNGLAGTIRLRLRYFLGASGPPTVGQ